VRVSAERGLLQARRSYPRVAGNVLAETVARSASVIALVILGLGVIGVGMGFVIGALIAWGLARLLVRRTRSLGWTTGADLAEQGHARGKGRHRAPKRLRPSLLGDTFVGLGTLLPLALLQNIDVVIVGWLNPAGSGDYAAISTACKVPVFLGLAVATYLVSEAAQHRREGRPAGRALAMALAIAVAPGLVLAGAAWFAARPILALAFGAGLSDAAPALWILALAMTFLAVTLLLSAYLLGVGFRGIVLALAVCSPLTVFALSGARGDFMMTAWANLACQALTALVVGVLVGVHRVRLVAAAVVPVPRPRDSSDAERDLAAPAAMG
jgi:O-antigen/teichoic acid export membrane protein